MITPRFASRKIRSEEKKLRNEDKDERRGKVKIALCDEHSAARQEALPPGIKRDWIAARQEALPPGRTTIMDTLSLVSKYLKDLEECMDDGDLKVAKEAKLFDALEHKSVVIEVDNQKIAIFTKAPLRAFGEPFMRKMVNDVNVEIHGLKFKANFVVLDYVNKGEPSIMFGRDFLVTTKSQVDFGLGEIRMNLTRFKESIEVIDLMEEEVEHRLFEVYFGKLEVDDKTTDADCAQSYCGSLVHRVASRERCQKRDLWMMSSLEESRGVNLAWIIADHLYKHAPRTMKNSVICARHYVTKIASFLGYCVDDEIKKCSDPIDCEYWTSKMLADELDEENRCLKKETGIPNQAAEGSSGPREEHGGECEDEFEGRTTTLGVTLITTIGGLWRATSPNLNTSSSRFATNEINNLKSGKGTSQRGNNNSGGQYGRLTKLEFPKFNGEDVQGWLYRVHQFFKIDHIEDDGHKIRLVSMHMFDKALNWYKQFVKRSREHVAWEEYERKIKIRFDSIYEDPMVELKNLRQTAYVQVFSLEVLGIDLDEDSDLLLTKEGVVNTYPNLVDEPPLISLNVMSGVNSYRTMRARGCMSKNTLHVLVDLRSTHNFLDLHTAKKLGYKVRKVCPLVVSVANRNVMTSLYECKGFTWVFQGVTYNVVVMIFPLRGCDMVLRFNGYLLWDAYDGTLKLWHPPNHKDAVELMVKELLDSGVIRISQSPFSSLIVMVKKKDGPWRMCVDYRKLNKYTVKDKFPIPVIKDLIDELNCAKVFSKLDLRSVFFDDILIYSRSMQEHVQHMRQMLTVMKTNSLFAKLSKCTFVINSVEYLGHIISDKGVLTDNSKIQAMQDWHVPQTIKQLREFLGLTRYYRRFNKNYALISQPLTALLKKNAFHWNKDA
ncbi:reverse transcriptase [Tanacetum coccineum]